MREGLATGTVCNGERGTSTDSDAEVTTTAPAVLLLLGFSNGVLLAREAAGRGARSGVAWSSDD